MNTLDALAQNPVLNTLGWTLIHFTWQGALVMFGLGALNLLWRRPTPQARYTTYLLALALLALLPLGTALLIHPSPAESLSAPAQSALAPTQPGAAVATAQSAAWPLVLSTAQTYLPHLLLAWAIGVCLLSSRLFGGWLYCQQLKRHAAQAAAHWQQSAAQLADRLQLGRRVPLLQSDRIPGPMTIGWLRPVILLPAGLLTGLPPQQAEAILLHELAHIRRSDYLVNILQRLMETLFFYHPAVWWISNRIRLEREYCCDDQAVASGGDALIYARALSNLEHQRQPAIALGAKDGALFKRIARLVDPSATTRRPAHGQLSGLVAALFLCACVGVFGQNLPGYPPTALLAQDNPPLAPAQALPRIDGEKLQALQRAKISLWVDETGKILTHAPLDEGRQSVELKLDRLADDLKALRAKFGHTRTASISFHPGADRDLVGQVAKIAQEAGLVYQQLSFLPKPQVLEEGAPYTFEIEAAEATHLKATIYDVRGQQIRSLHDGAVKAGTHTLVWDGSDDQGGSPENGIYFCRVRLGPENMVLKVVKK